MAKQKKTQLEKWLHHVYYTPKQASSYGGVQSVQREVNKKKKTTIQSVQKWLSQQDTYTLHKPVRYKFRRRQTIVGGIDHQWQADLVDMTSLSIHNNGIKYLLTCVDVLTRFGWVQPLTNKTGKSLVAAFTKIFQTGRKPLALQTDKGR